MTVTDLSGEDYERTIDEYAKMFEDLAKAIRERQEPPMAAYILICHRHGGAERFRKVQQGFNLLNAVGLMECWKDDIIYEIKGGQ